FDAGLKFRDHATGNGAILHQRAGLLDGEFLDQIAFLVEHTAYIGEKEKAGSAHRSGNGACGRIGIDVVCVSVRRYANRRDHGDDVRLLDHLQDFRIDRSRLADKAEIENLLDIRFRIVNLVLDLARNDQIAILAAKADRAATRLIELRHDLLVDRDRKSTRLNS